MNLKVKIGKGNDNQDFYIDFNNQEIHQVLLAGSTGTGKSVLGYHIYRQLVEQNYAKEITFVLIDNVRVEFTHWNQESNYLYCPDIVDQQEAFSVLESLASQADVINLGNKHYFIHIEECDLVVADPERMKNIIQTLLRVKQGSKFHVVFSSSRPSPEVFTDWLLTIANITIVFELPDKLAYRTVSAGRLDDVKLTSTGSKVIILDSAINYIEPLTIEEVMQAESFKL